MGVEDIKHIFKISRIISIEFLKFQNKFSKYIDLVLETIALPKILGISLMHH